MIAAEYTKFIMIRDDKNEQLLTCKDDLEEKEVKLQSVLQEVNTYCVFVSKIIHFIGDRESVEQ